MPRYFFHVRDGFERLDREGVELPGIDEARVAAVVASGEALRDHGRAFWDGTEWLMWVTDDAGETVCGLRFSAEQVSASPSPPFQADYRPATSKQLADRPFELPGDAGFS
jgi:hypothetical protein